MPLKILKKTESFYSENNVYKIECHYYDDIYDTLFDEPGRKDPEVASAIQNQVEILVSENIHYQIVVFYSYFILRKEGIVDV